MMMDKENIIYNILVILLRISSVVFIFSFGFIAGTAIGEKNSSFMIAISVLLISALAKLILGVILESFEKKAKE